MATIDELEAQFLEAEKAEEASVKAKRVAAERLAQARAAADGIKVGQLVEHEVGNRTMRGKITRIGRARYEFAWQRRYSVHVVSIKKNGTQGIREIELRSTAFFPNYADETPTARVISDNTNPAE